MPDDTDAQWPDPLRAEAYWGPVGNIVRMIEPQTESDPAALLLQLLTATGNLIGRRAYFSIEASQHFPRLNTVVVGSTSKSRKGTSWSHIRNVLALVDRLWASKRIQGGLSSGEGLIQAVSDEGPKDKRLLIVESEFASVLQVAARTGNTFSTMIRQAWDSGDIRTLTKEPLVASNTHISLIGHITKGELLERLNTTEAANGFGNRILWTCASRSKKLPHGGSLAESVLTGMADTLREPVEWLRPKDPPIRLNWDANASLLWESVYDELSEGKPGMFGSVTSRAEAYVIRLALIYALLDCSDEIWEEHLQAALAVWEYCESSAKFIFGDATGNPTADAILKALRQTPEGLSRTDISALFDRNKDAKTINTALEVLAAQGRAKKGGVRPIRGRPSETWIAVGA
jgi:hypothetical protein